MGGPYQGSHQAYGVLRDSNVMLSMRDGVKLATDIYYPATDGRVAEGVFPVVLERTPYDKAVSNQQKWDTLGAERSGAGWRFGELPEGPVVASSPFDGLSLHLLPAL